MKFSIKSKFMVSFKNKNNKTCLLWAHSSQGNNWPHYSPVRQDMCVVFCSHNLQHSLFIMFILTHFIYLCYYLDAAGIYLYSQYLDKNHCEFRDRCFSIPGKEKSARAWELRDGFIGWLIINHDLVKKEGRHFSEGFIRRGITHNAKLNSGGQKANYANYSF